MSTTDDATETRGPGRPSSGRVRYHSTMDPDLHRRLKTYCNEGGIKFNEAVDNAVRAYLDQRRMSAISP